MDDCCKDQGGDVKVVMREGVGLFIVAKIEWFSSPHQVHCISSKANENYFHDKEIKASPYED